MAERVVVGVDLGGTNARVVAAGADGVILRELRQPTDARGGEALVAQLVRLARAAAEPAAPAAVAIGTAGVVDPRTREVALATNIAGWDGAGARLAAELGVPVLLENDANLAALGEHRAGRGRGVQSLAFVSVGTGLGMGLVLGGELVRGARGLAGELGFLPLAAGAGRGALERALSGAGVVAAAARHERWRRPPPARAEDVFALAAAGDGAAAAVVAEVGRLLGATVAAVAAVVDPELVVVGGGVGGNEALLAPARTEAARLLPLPPRIERSALAGRAALHGAVALALTAPA